MTVYHGAQAAIPQPDILHSRKRVDFGPGFYVTPIQEQAVAWARRFRKEKNGTPVVSRYALDEEKLNAFKVLSLSAYDKPWLDFVVACRREMDNSDYDVVMGGVANDRVFDTIELFLSGLIQEREALGRLRYQAVSHQICLRSQAVINACLSFQGAEILGGRK